MLNDIVEARLIENFRVFLRFDDGKSGEVDLEPLLVPFDGVFAPLRDPLYFAELRVNPDTGTIVWPNGADLCPDVLRNKLTGEPLPRPQAISQPVR